MKRFLLYIIFSVATLGAIPEVFGYQKGYDRVKNSGKGGKSFKPLNRGATGRNVPKNLKEKLALEEIMSNPVKGQKIPVKMTDTRWPSKEGWVKMQYEHISLDNKKINIHYLAKIKDGVIKAVDDFKFK